MLTFGDYSIHFPDIDTIEQGEGYLFAERDGVKEKIRFHDYDRIYQIPGLPEGRIREIILDIYDLRPAAIIEYLDLLRPIYAKTAAYGHFGWNEPEFAWEKTSEKEAMRKAA